MFLELKKKIIMWIKKNRRKIKQTVALSQESGKYLSGSLSKTTPLNLDGYQMSEKIMFKNQNLSVFFIVKKTLKYRLGLNFFD